MTTPINIPEKKIKSLFFKDERSISERKLKKAIEPISNEVRKIPFFDIESNVPLSLDIEKRETDKIEVVLPKEAVDTKDPAVNDTKFVYKNSRIVLENQFMVLQLIRQLNEIENYLLFLLVDKRNAATPNDIQSFLDALKERLVLFRDPINQNLYAKFDSFYTEYQTVLNYLKENRAWPKPE